MALRISVSELADIERLVEQTDQAGQTADYFLREFRKLAAKHGWPDWWPGTDKISQRRTTVLIRRTQMRRRYMDTRWAQLVDGNFRFWIYRDGGDLPGVDPLHDDLDGLMLAPDHPFWQAFFPPNGWKCGCSVVGARSERVAARLGGDLSKPLPRWIGQRDPATGQFIGVDEGFLGRTSPSVEQTLQAILGGRVSLES